MNPRACLALFFFLASARAHAETDPALSGGEAPAAQRAIDQGKAELDDLRQKELNAGLAGAPRSLLPPAILTGPLRADFLSALGDSMDGLPPAAFAPAPGAPATLPELDGISLADLRAKYDIPIELNADVVLYVRFFQIAARDHFARWLSRSTRFLPMMRRELARAGLPLDTVYLSMIESGFSSFALSWVRAAGLWQFMAPTGRMMGLRSDFWVDERRDPFKSTLAAARYLKELHQQFGDWYLAWAAYNGGCGKVARAERTARSEDFWDLAKGRVLRRETKGYVPKLIAAALIARHPDRFGFHDIAYEPPLDYDEAEVDSPTDLAVVAKAAGVTVEAVQALNPELRRSCTPPGSWRVKLPKGTAPSFVEAIAKWPAGERLASARHVVERGDSLARLATVYGVSAAIIAKANGLSARGRLPPGHTVTIPLAASTGLASNVKEAEAHVRRTGKRVNTKVGPGQYVVRDGDSLWGIAKRFGLSLEQIKELNGLNGARARNLRIGDVLVVRG